MTRLRVAQWGTGHGHAEGKLIALRGNADIDLVGVIEPDPARRAALDQPGSGFHGVRWFPGPDEVLNDPSIAAVAAEGRNDESLPHAAAIVGAGKHLWYDKPGGDDWAGWQALAGVARARGLLVQMGYMFRYHHGFSTIADWVQGGVLGTVFGIRAHMSTHIPLAARQVIAQHQGGILYDLGGHMIDQIVRLLGRPDQVTAFLRQDAEAVAGFADNTLGVLSFPRALATIDIAAMEPTPTARRFEVYGSRGSAIMEPFEPAGAIRLCLLEGTAGFAAGEQRVPVPVQTRQALYEREAEAFVATIRGQRPPDRSLEHETLVQQTLLRLTGRIG